MPSLLKLCPRLHRAFFVSLLAMSSYHVYPSIDRFDTAVLDLVTPLLLCRPCHYTVSKHLQFCPRRRHTLFVALSVLLPYHAKPSTTLSETSHTLPRLLCCSVSLRSHHVQTLTVLPEASSHKPPISLCYYVTLSSHYVKTLAALPKAS